MLTSQMIKEAALAAGADLCGIGNMERFEGAPPDMDPRYLFPEAKSVIGFAFRIPRGVQRGIEEGTQFYQYPSMAYGGINEIFAPAVLYTLGKFIEDHGYEAMVYFNLDRVRDLSYLQELSDYQFWLAMYDRPMEFAYKVDMWQYSCTGTVPGIDADVDLNLYFPYE